MIKPSLMRDEKEGGSGDSVMDTNLKIRLPCEQGLPAWHDQGALWSNRIDQFGRRDHG